MKTLLKTLSLTACVVSSSVFAGDIPSGDITDDITGIITNKGAYVINPSTAGKTITITHAGRSEARDWNGSMDLNGNDANIIVTGQKNGAFALLSTVIKGKSADDVLTITTNITSDTGVLPVMKKVAFT